MSTSSLAPLGRKLHLLGLAPEDHGTILASVSGVRRAGPNEPITRQGPPPSHGAVLLEGFAARSKMGVHGERQILGFCIPGDFCTPQTAAAVPVDYDVSAVTACTVAMIPRRTLFNLAETDARVAIALWRDTAAEAAIEREWLFNLGRRQATARLAHLFCEMQARLQRAGLASGATFRLPVTQKDLADAAGLSTVHVNRSLQELRRLQLIIFMKGELTVLDPDGLETLAGFDGAYLDLQEGAARATRPQSYLRPEMQA